AIADPMFSGANAPVCAVTTLAPSDRTTCTAHHSVTQADLDAGSVQNTAVAGGTDPSSAAVTSAPASAVASADQTPRLGLVKSASPATITAAGAAITYTFHVTNTGNVTISGLSIDDSFIRPAAPQGRALTCVATTLAPGTSTDCTTTYNATQTDIDNGSITNT